MTDARTSRPHEALAAAARRDFLLNVGASAVALALAGTVGLPLTMSSAFAFAPPAGGGLDAFTALTKQLTGRATLDATLASRIYNAMSKSDSAFAANVAALNTWLKANAGVPSDRVVAVLQSQDPALAKAVVNIVRAWYLGLVGQMPTIQVVAYERALMFDPVTDVLTIPSYCRDVPFYWTQKPAGV